jgi:hypothetical protein
MTDQTYKTRWQYAEIQIGERKLGNITTIHHFTYDECGKPDNPDLPIINDHGM